MIRTRRGWLRAVRKNDESLYYDRLGKVKLVHSNELDGDEWLWAIVAEGTDFWMGAFSKETDARNFCATMNWVIVP
jgi:hypothetical protein